MTTYAIQEPPSAHIVFATNCKASAWRFARSMRSAVVHGIGDHGHLGSVFFSKGRRLECHSPCSISPMYLNHLRRSRGLVNLPMREPSLAKRWDPWMEAKYLAQHGRAMGRRWRAAHA